MYLDIFKYVSHVRAYYDGTIEIRYICLVIQNTKHILSAFVKYIYAGTCNDNF